MRWYAARKLWRRRAYSVAVIATLGVGIGATLTVLSIADAVLDRPFDFYGAHRLVLLWEKGDAGAGVSLATFRDWQRQTQAFDGMAAERRQELPLAIGAQTTAAAVDEVTPAYFNLLGVRLVAGVGIGDAARTAVLRRRAGIGREALGASIVLDGRPYRVVGIAAGTTGMPDAWIPPPQNAAVLPRRARNFTVMARLRPGVTQAQASADLARVEAQLRRRDAADYRGWRTSVESWQAAATQDRSGAFLLLLGGVGLVLLLCCANAAGLSYVQALRRRQELAVMRALGASRRQIALGLLAESSWLAAAAGAAGGLAAWWSTGALIAQLPAEMAPAAGAAWDGRVWGAALALVAAVALLSGLAPALGGTRELEGALKQAPQAGLWRRNWGFRLLVAGQCLLAVVALGGSGLMLNTWARLQRVPLGFEANHLIVIGPCAPKVATACARLAAQAEAAPGIVSYSATSDFPLGGDTTLSIARTDRRHPATLSRVGPGYFKTLQTPLLQGREFGPGDGPGAAIVSQRAAQAWWPGQPGLGQRLDLDGGWRTVVGVAGNVERTPTRVSMLPYAPAQYPEVYTPLASGATAVAVIRTRNQPATLAANLHSAEVRTGAAMLAQHLAAEREITVLLGLFALLALGAAGTGIAGLMAYAAAARTHEVGVRLALGAHPGRLAWFLSGEGLGLAGAGIAAGWVVAWQVSPRLLGAYVYGIGPADPATLGGASLAMLALAALACWLPARRAARADVACTLRRE
ncbi:MAG TPA: FtsX-like permease family protein [Terriglobales bacterium]|nr:FtsX-like permease family protein [Terriglobales bacterium]